MYLDLHQNPRSLFNTKGPMCVLPVMIVAAKGAYKTRKLISKVLFNQRALTQLEKDSLHFLLGWNFWW